MRVAGVQPGNPLRGEFHPAGGTNGEAWDKTLFDATGSKSPGQTQKLAVIDPGGPGWRGGDNMPTSSDYLKQLGLTDPQALNALQQIYNHWDEWGFHQGVTFQNPADPSVNADAKSFVEYIAQNPDILNAWLKYSGDSGGKLTKAGLGDFLHDYKRDITNAYGDYQTFLHNNPNATDAQKQQARELALLEANQSIILGGDKYFSIDKLNSFASNNPNFGQAVIDAAKTWSDPAMFARVDNAGSSYGESKPDGLFDSGNIHKYLSGERITTSASIWGSLGTDDAGREQFNKPLDVSEEIYNHWDQWGFHEGISFKSPADSNVDPAAKEFVEFAGQNPALVAAWDKNGDGTITKDELGQFINGAKDDIKAAEAAYKDYLNKNPNADPASKELARDAALAAANRYLIGKGSTYLNHDQLANFAGGADANPGIDKDIFEAAKLMSDPGVLRQFDIAGNNPADTKYDGTFGVENVTQWLANYAPKDIVELTSFLDAAATSSLVAGVDTSQLGPNIFAHPENYDGKTKAAALMQLMDAYRAFQAGIDSELWNPYGEEGINGNKDKVKAELEDKIALLSRDPDVTKFLADNRAGALQNIVNADPGLKDQLSSYYDNTFSQGAGFSDILGRKDANGNPLSLPDAVSTFVITAQTLYTALGREGHPDLTGILQKSGHADEVKQYYLDNIVTGKALTDALSGGTDLETALIQFYGNVAAFNSVLDPQLVSDNAATLDSNVVDTVFARLFDQGSADDLLKAYGDGNGNLDEAKLRQMLAEAEKTNPEMFKDASGSRISPDDIVGAFRGVWDMVRQGAKFTDALDKLSESFTKPNNGVMTAYNKGVFHVVSALMMGGVLGARAGQNGTSPQAQAEKVSAGFQLAGLLMEGSSKYTKTVDPANRPFSSWLSNANLSKIENFGKILGGLGNVLAGGFSIASGVNSLNQGDKVGAGLGLTGGLLGIMAGLTSGAEGVASLLGSGLTAGLGLASSVLGFAAGLFAFGAVIGLAIWEVVKHANQQSAFYDNLLPTLHQYGITGGPMEESDYPITEGAA